MLSDRSYKLSTTFPLKLWKTFKTPLFFKVCTLLLCLFVLFSCTYFKKTKSQEPAKEEKPSKADDRRTLDSSVISMTEEEVKKKFGEPNMVSKTSDNHILWTYRPSWKLMPDNTNTIYIEFEDGKVIKILKVR